MSLNLAPITRAIESYNTRTSDNEICGEWVNLFRRGPEWIPALVVEVTRLRVIVDQFALLFNDFDENVECDTCGRCRDCPTCDALAAYADYKRGMR